MGGCGCVWFGVVGVEVFLGGGLCLGLGVFGFGSVCVWIRS